MSQRKPKQTIILLSIGLILAFCLGKTIYGFIIENSVLNKLKAGFLNTEKACKLPCWNGIIPGETNVIKALSILALDSEVNSFWWNFRDSLHGMNVTWGPAPIIFDVVMGGMEWEDKTVTGITFFHLRNLSVSEIIYVLGEPSFIELLSPNSIHMPWNWYILLYYPERGVVLSFRTEDGSSEVSPSNKLDYLSLTTVEAVEIRLEEAKAYQTSHNDQTIFLRPWSGYGDIHDVYLGDD